MPYGLDQGAFSGSEHNVWGGIKRAFHYLDPDLDVRLYSVNGFPMDDSVDVSMRDKNDHGNTTSLTISREPVSLPRLHELLVGQQSSQITSRSFVEFINEFDLKASESEFVFLMHQCPSQQTGEDCWLFFRASKRAWNRSGPVPRSRVAIKDDSESLLHALATIALFYYCDSEFADGPRSRTFLLNEEELLERAVARLVAANATHLGLDPFNWLHFLADLNQFSLLSYEQRIANACVVVTNPKKQPLAVTFRRPLEHGRYRLSRKLIELGTIELPIVSDGSSLYGLVDRKVLGNSHVDIRFLGRHHWQWNLNGCVLFEIRDGMPGVRRPRFDSDSLKGGLTFWLDRDEPATNRILEVVHGVVEAGCGGMVIVSKEAEQEALRFEHEALPINVQPLSRDQASSLTRIDGSILLDGKGEAHCVGFIVDGLACPDGTLARGSRFNCARRYIEGKNGKAIAIVVSSDGTVDLVIPNATDMAVRQKNPKHRRPP